MKPLFPSIRELQDSLRNLMSGVRGVLPERVTEDKDKKERKKTRKGATHKVNPVFKSRRLIKQTPAQYRRYHMGNPHKYAYEMMKGVKRAQKYQTV